MERIKEENINTAVYWDQYSDESWLEADRKRSPCKSDAVIEHVPANSNVLDVGCLGGNFRGYVLEQQVSISKFTGLDLSPNSINIAKKRFPEDSWVVSDCHKLPFEDSIFDVVTIMEVLEHVDIPEKVLFEIRRVLKDKGVILITVPNELKYPDDEHIWMFDTTTLRELLINIGEVLVKK
jgi:ubiquinone/menaquinone biosynthesis C-methylase UbiE